MVTEMPKQTIQVLAVASHVTYGYVGNKMATFVMQALGYDVSAIDTVHYSNHLAYRQHKGRRVPPEEVQELYDGLKSAGLDDFDMMLSGYAASKEVVEIVGKIGRDLQDRARMKPGSFFWVLDPVMGDNGRLYVAEDIVPVYRSLISHADMIVPNAFEAELLAEMKITDMKSLATAILELHRRYQIPHIIITSLAISPESKEVTPEAESEVSVVVGSSCRSDRTPRLFSVTYPTIPVFFSGTGDMFAALTICRLREAISSFALEPSKATKEANSGSSLLSQPSWLPPDSVSATQLPLAKAVERTLASMYTVLQKTTDYMHSEIGDEETEEGDAEDKRRMHLRKTKMTEVRPIKYVDDLKDPKTEVNGIRFEAEEVRVEIPEENKADQAS